jgi:hypothetical protein
MGRGITLQNLCGEVLREFPDYYSRLAKLEEKADKYWASRRRG